MVFESDSRLAKKKKDRIKRDGSVNSKAGVLTEQDIRDRLKGKPGDVHTLVITPFAHDFDKDSIDLRLGCCFFIPKAHQSPCFIPGITNTLHLYSEQYVPYGSYLVLPAHHTVLGSTLEYIKLPSDVSGQILTKSSWGRTFITIEAAPWIHPLYRGCLTLEIANASNCPIILYPGLKVAQLILLKTMQDTAEDELDKMDGTYIGPVRPEPAQLLPPENALVSIGLKKQELMYPFDEFLDNEYSLQHIIHLLKERGYKIGEP